jgi:hypothetical protein
MFFNYMRRMTKRHHRNLRRKLSTKKRQKKRRHKYKTKRQAFTGGNADENQCSICFESLDSEQQPLFTGAKCKHVFHAACINTWCANRNFNSINDCTCPLCRELLYEDNPDLPEGRLEYDEEVRQRSLPFIEELRQRRWAYEEEEARHRLAHAEILAHAERRNRAPQRPQRRLAFLRRNRYD